MSQRVPKSEWAIEKVRVFVGSCPEKVTLMAIAGYINYETGVAWCARSTIAADLGKSSRTVQRHIQTLVREGLLIADRPEKYEHRTSRYMIPCCSLTVNELEFISGLPGDQLNLGIISRDEQGSLFISDGTLKSVVERQWESNCLTMGDKMSPDGRQNVSLTVPNQLENRESGVNFHKNGEMALLKKGEKTMKARQKARELEAQRVADRAREPAASGMAILAQENPALYDQILGVVKTADGPAPKIGTHLRERIFGSQENYEAAYRDAGLPVPLSVAAYDQDLAEGDTE